MSQGAEKRWMETKLQLHQAWTLCITDAVGGRIHFMQGFTSDCVPEPDCQGLPVL